MGISNYKDGCKPLFKITKRNKEKEDVLDGAINENGNIMGTYIHGVFDGVNFREYIVNTLRIKKGMEIKSVKEYERLREKEIDKLAEIVRESLNMEYIYKTIGLK